jgi:predicted O-methyltransferase YrrM
VEIGSHKGRSTVVLGFAAMTAGARVTAIDPFVDGAMFGGKATRSVFEDHIRDSGLTDVVDLLPIPSSDARRHWTAPIDFLYIDGKHDYWSVVDDLRWLPLLAPNARVGIHDAFCSVGVTSALIDRALIRGELRYEGRMSTLAVFRPGRPSGSQRRNFTRQMPWFTRNVVIKAARRLNARPVVRALGHNDPWDPY